MSVSIEYVLWKMISIIVYSKSDGVKKYRTFFDAFKAHRDWIKVKLGGGVVSWGSCLTIFLSLSVHLFKHESNTQRKHFKLFYHSSFQSEENDF